MTAFTYINVWALAAIFILACSFGTTPVNGLTTEVLHVRNPHPHGHAGIAKRKRSPSNSNRCKVKSSSLAPTSTKASSSKTYGKSTETSSYSSKTTSSHSSVSTYKPPPSGGGGKVGIAWANGDATYLKNFKTSQTKYLYTWGPTLPSECESLGFTCIPMLWGRNQVTQFKSLVKKGYSNYVLGFNEPNEDGQSNMSPQEGASLWKQYIEPLRNEGYSTISPATSSNPNGKVWITDFFKACAGGCTTDGIATHYYDVTSAGLIAWISYWHTTYKQPVWLTEFACQNFNGGSQASQSEVDTFFQESISYMESQDWVAGYFAFGIMGNMQGVNTDNKLLGNDNMPNALGEKYINAAF